MTKFISRKLDKHSHQSCLVALDFCKKHKIGRFSNFSNPLNSRPPTGAAKAVKKTKWSFDTGSSPVKGCSSPPNSQHGIGTFLQETTVPPTIGHFNSINNYSHSFHGQRRKLVFSSSSSFALDERQTFLGFFP